MPLNSYSIATFSSAQQGFVPGDALIRAASDEYVEALLQQDLNRASRVVEALTHAGVDVGDIYQQLVATTIISLAGELANRSLSQSRFSSFLEGSRRIMESLVDRHKPSPEHCRALSAVLGCVEGEWHSLGCRMVADFLEMDGWIVHYLGENVAAANFLGTVRAVEPDIIGVSVTQFSLLASVRQLIQDLCRLECADRFKIMVGGYPLSVNPGLCRELGADFTARDARDASHKANRYVSQLVTARSEFAQWSPYLA